MEGDRDRELAALVEAARTGDRSALERLCTQLQKLIRGYFWNKFQDATLVDELAQETNLRMLKNFEHLRDTTRVRGFVTKIAFHVGQDHLRRKYRSREEALEPLIEAGAAVASVAPEAERIVDDVALEGALSELPERSRKVLLLKVEGHKYQEISDLMGMSVSAVKMQVKRSMEKLRASVFSVTFWPVAATVVSKLIQLSDGVR